MSLEGKHILLGVSSSVSIYKALEILRELRKRNADVRVLMTPSAAKMVSPMLFETLSGYRVCVDLFSRDAGWEMDHIANAQWGDLLLIAPATANIIGKCANGIADNAVSTLFLAFEGPVFVAPAMNSRMFRHPAHKMNLIRLERLGVRVVPPGEGDLACGEKGIGRLADVATIITHIENFFSKTEDLKGRHVLVTAGPTREYIDPARFISNPSSGKMGLALAEEAADRGAQVTLVTGAPESSRHPHVESVRVVSAEDMAREVTTRASSQDAFIFAAAVADYKPASRQKSKMKKSEADLSLALVRTPDISREVAVNKQSHQVLVGFAAESENIIENAQEKLREKKFDLIVANDISRTDVGFASDDNEVVLIEPDTQPVPLPRMSKREAAARIIDRVSALLAAKGKKT